MCFINYKKRLIYYHIPKCGGNTVIKQICENYGFAEIAKSTHQNYESFFTEENKHFIDDFQDKHAIREKGKLQYYYSHQEADPAVLDAFFSFTFVRNPYTKLYSAYCYLNRHIMHDPTNPTIRGSKENASYYVDFNTFVKHYTKVNNIAFFHAFIPQCEQLRAPSGAVEMSYIGRTGNLDNDLCCVLLLNGLPIHPEHSVEIFNEERRNKTELEKNKCIQYFYNEESFRFANDLFEKDFQLFGYKKFNSFEEFKKADLSKAPSTEIHKNCQILKNYLRINEIFVEQINTIVEQIISLLSNHQQNNQLLLLKQQIEFLMEKKQKDERKFHLQQKIETIETQCLNLEVCKTCPKCKKKTWNELSWHCHFLTCSV